MLLSGCRQECIPQEPEIAVKYLKRGRATFAVAEIVIVVYDII